MGLELTLGLIAGLLVVIGGLVWRERRPRPLGQVSLVPTTPLLFVALVVLVAVLAHLVSLVTGHPHMGRFG
ncbi:MAG: hypothetical protein C0605_13210 [Hyphomicrobiales bacterium]|nr:MAG: hypothetical protein C0605_13210 [Hyphomicrobiales bacterium]